MDKFSEMIWQRGSAWQIMQEARKRFRDTVGTNRVSAHVALASVHYSLIKRYTQRWWYKPLALWHLRGAVFHANRVLSEFTPRTFDQVDVCATILSKSPIKSDRETAGALLRLAFDRPDLYEGEMKPHTRALMLITLGKIEYRRGEVSRAWGCFHDARALIPAIETEESSDREQQLVRVLVAVGFFYYEHHLAESEKYWARKLLVRALDLADRVAKDQAEKIRAKWRQVGY